MMFGGVVTLVLWGTSALVGGVFLDVPWTPVVTVAQGRLRGLVDTTYNKYLGIPYARVERRFKAPVDPRPWKGIFDAIVDRKCKQLIPRLKFPYGTERNCLILNVYTPKDIRPDRPAPVMLFIHGGGFNFGSGTSLIYGPERFMNKGVVLVTINYRVGAFGFLCLHIEGAPGNAGLKDQVAALRWVSKNIKQFGGDPNSVTIFGESAGAASAHLMVLSKMAKGLFHRAILESNTAISPILFAYDPIEKASKIAKKLGYETMDPKELLQIFRNTSANDIMWATESDDVTEKFNFRPCAEKVFPGIEPFLTESPYAVLSSGVYNQVPMIIGFNNCEGIFFVGTERASFQKYGSNVEPLLPDNIDFKNEEDREALADMTSKFYLGNKTIEKESLANIVGDVIDFSTDAYFYFAVVKATELHLSTSDKPIYNYYFTYESPRNLGKSLAHLPEQRGATHFDETFFLFEPSARWAPLAGADLLVAERMTQLWTDFAKTSSPTPKRSPSAWSASAPAQIRFYEIDSEPRMREPPHPTRLAFWRQAYETHGFRT